MDKHAREDRSEEHKDKSNINFIIIKWEENKNVDLPTSDQMLKKKKQVIFDAINVML